MRSDTQAAETIARYLCKRHHCSWRDILGSVWETVAKERARGTPEKLMVRAAHLDILDATSTERRRLKRNGVTLRQLSGNHAAEREERETALSVWCESRRARAEIGIRARVWLYLRLVEGWAQNEIAATMGVCEARVSKVLTDAVRELGSGKPAQSLGA